MMITIICCVFRLEWSRAHAYDVCVCVCVPRSVDLDGVLFSFGETCAPLHCHTRQFGYTFYICRKIVDGAPYTQTHTHMLDTLLQLCKCNCVVVCSFVLFSIRCFFFFNSLFFISFIYCCIQLKFLSAHKNARWAILKLDCIRDLTNHTLCVCVCACANLR